MGSAPSPHATDASASAESSRLNEPESMVYEAGEELNSWRWSRRWRSARPGLSLGRRCPRPRRGRRREGASARAEQEAAALPSAAQLGSELRELLQRPERAPGPGPRVAREGVGADERVEVFERGGAQLDASHELQLVERNGLAGFCLPPSEPGALVRAGDAVQQLDHVPRIGVCFVERARRQRAGQRSLLDMRSLSQSGQLRRPLAVEDDVAGVEGSPSSSLSAGARCRARRQSRGRNS